MKFLRYRLVLLLFLIALALVPSVWLIQPVDAQILGSGWTGTFFLGTNLSGNPAASNVQYPTGICANWGTGIPFSGSNTPCQPGGPISGVPQDNFSAQFTSTQNFTQAGVYRFTVVVDDAVRLAIDGNVVIDRFTQTNAQSTYEVDVNLTAGNHSLRVDYAEFTGNAVIQVQWGFGGASVPTSTPVPAATGQVIRVRGLALRTGPYLGASLVGVARPGASYAILERNRDEGLFIWYRITVGDNTGWVSGRYFEITGNIELIPFTGTIFDQIDGAPDIGVVGVTRAIMNLRRRPSERTQILDKVPWGAEVPVVGRTIQGGRNFWLQVRYNGKVGWIYAPYVGLRGVVDAVPIR